MDYEKKYKEALEWARKVMQGKVGFVLDEVLEKFPELKKESKDKMIRKTISDILLIDSDEIREVLDTNNILMQDINAWLEAQGEHANFRNNIQIGDKVTRNEAGILVNISQLNRVAKKRGEQKSTLPKWKYKNDNTPLLRDSIILNKYGCVAKSPSGALVSDVWVIDYAELAKLPKEEIEKQGEQKPAIIIPKFRVGDEIKTSNEESLTITKIDEKGYWSEDLFICGFDDADTIDRRDAFEYGYLKAEKDLELTNEDVYDI